MGEIVAAVKVISAAIEASKIFQAVKAVLQVVAAVQAIVSVTKGRPKGLTQERQADVLSLTLGEGPREALFGEVCTGGALEDVFNWGATNEWEVQVITVADHVCEAAIGYFVGDVYRAWPGDGVQTGYSGALEIYFFNGSLSGAAQSYLIANSGGRWTSPDTLSGCSGFVFAYKFDEKVWASGRPTFKWVMRGARLYDPRKDSTVTGGSGAHRWTNPATYEWTDNAAVCAYNYRRGIYTNGQLLVGPGRSATEAPPEPIIAAANVCDELVALKAGGNERRYRIGARVAANETWLSVEEKFAEAMAGDIVERAGSLSIDVGVAKTAVYTFTDDDLVADTAVTVQAKIGRRDLVNTVASTFVDPTKLWQAVAGPLRRSLTDITTDGEARELPIELEYVTSGTQAQRIAEIVRRKARLQRTAVVTLGPEAMLLEAGDWVTWTSARYAGGTARTYVISSVELSDDLRVTLQLREIASSVYSWTAATDQLDSLAPSYTAPGALGAATLAGFNATAVSITGAGGSTIPAISATWTPPTDASIFAIRLEWRKVGDTNTLDAVTLLPGAGQMIVAGGITSATDFEIRGVAITDPVRDATPTAWRTVTSGALAAATAGVASSITGQGDLATANRSSLPFGVNGVPNSEFTYNSSWPPLGWASGAHGTGSTKTDTIVVANGRRSVKSVLSGTPVSGAYVDICYNDSSNIPAYFFPIAPGETIGGSWLVARNASCSSVNVTLIFYNQALTYISETSSAVSTSATNGDTNDPANYTLASIVATAPAGARWAQLVPRGFTNGGATPTIWAMQPMLARLQSGQAAVPAYSPTPADRRADVTASNMAASISGQGALATRSSVDFSTGDVTNRTANNLTYTAGGTVDSLRPGEAGANVTETRTAASISGQGDLATANRSSLPIGVNGLPNSEFTYNSSWPPLGWASGGHGTGSTKTDTIVIANGRRSVKSVLSGTPVSGAYVDICYNDSSNIPAWFFPVTPGERVGASWLVARNASCSSVNVTLIFYDQAFAYISETSSAVSTSATNGDTNDPANYTLASVVATVPASARWAQAVPRGFTNGGATPTIWAMQPMLARVAAGQTVVPPYSPTSADRRADVTASNTAAAVSGQGPLATQTFPTYAGNAAALSAGLTPGQIFLDSTDSNKAKGVVAAGAGAAIGQKSASGTYSTSGATAVDWGRCAFTGLVSGSVWRVYVTATGAALSSGTIWRGTWELRETTTGGASSGGALVGSGALDLTDTGGGLIDVQGLPLGDLYNASGSGGRDLVLRVFRTSGTNNVSTITIELRAEIVPPAS